MRGRDIEEAEHAVQFDPRTCRWRILGDVQDVRRSDTRNKILSALKASEEPRGPQEVAQSTGLAEDVVKSRLRDMVRDGEVMKLGHGKYTMPNRQ